jgi:hypothetical protein
VGATALDTNDVCGILSQALPATHFSVSAPGTAISGVPFNVTVTALDANNNTVTGYAGTVQISLGTLDSGAVLPADYTFTTADGNCPAFS